MLLKINTTFNKNKCKICISDETSGDIPSRPLTVLHIKETKILFNSLNLSRTTKKATVLLRKISCFSTLANDRLLRNRTTRLCWHEVYMLRGTWEHKGVCVKRGSLQSCTHVRGCTA